jgi:hypothetical protein
MTAAIDNPYAASAPTAEDSVARTLHMNVSIFMRGVRPRKKKMAWGSAQPLEKAHFRQADPRKSKLFSWEKFGWGLGWLGWILKKLESALKTNFRAFVQACLAAGCERRAAKHTTSGWRSLDSVPKSALEARPPASFWKIMIGGRPRGRPLKPMEHRR